MEVLVVASVWLLFGCFGSWIASAKRRGGVEGFSLGILFGPLGCLIEALLPNVSEAKYKADNEARFAKIAANRALKREINRHTIETGVTFVTWIARSFYGLCRAFCVGTKTLIVRISPWFHETIIRFGWYKALPEIAQPIVIGCGVSIPLVAILVLFLRSR